MLGIVHGVGKLAKRVALAKSPIKSTGGSAQTAHVTLSVEMRQTRSMTLTSRLASLCQSMLETSIHSPPKTSEPTLDQSIKMLSLKTETVAELAESTKPPAQDVNVVEPSAPKYTRSSQGRRRKEMPCSKQRSTRYQEGMSTTFIYLEFSSMSTMKKQAFIQPTFHNFFWLFAIVLDHVLDFHSTCSARRRYPRRWPTRSCKRWRRPATTRTPPTRSTSTPCFRCSWPRHGRALCTTGKRKPSVAGSK